MHGGEQAKKAHTSEIPGRLYTQPAALLSALLHTRSMTSPWMSIHRLGNTIRAGSVALGRPATVQDRRCSQPTRIGDAYPVQNRSGTGPEVRRASIKSVSRLS